jgi:hypothetical protein
LSANSGFPGAWSGGRVFFNAGPEFEQGRREGVRLSLSEAVEEGLDVVR